MLAGFFSNAEKLLESGEEIQMTVHPSRFHKDYVKHYSIAILLTAGILVLVSGVLGLEDLPVSRDLLLGLFVVPGGILLWSEIRRMAVMYHFTDKKFIEEEGIMKKSFSSTPYRDITRVNIQQGVNQRMVGIGNLQMEVRGSDSEEILVEGIRNPQRFRVRLSGGDTWDEEETLPEDAADDTPGEQEVSQQRQQGQQLTKEDIEAELGRVYRKQRELEEQHQNGQVSQEEYERRWYMIQGEIQALERQLDRLPA